MQLARLGMFLAVLCGLSVSAQAMMGRLGRDALLAATVVAASTYGVSKVDKKEELRKLVFKHGGRRDIFLHRQITHKPGSVIPQGTVCVDHHLVLQAGPTAHDLLMRNKTIHHAPGNCVEPKRAQLNNVETQILRNVLGGSVYNTQWRFWHEESEGLVELSQFLYWDSDGQIDFDV
jgi:hypothetical protein